MYLTNDLAAVCGVLAKAKKRSCTSKLQKGRRLVKVVLESYVAFENDEGELPKYSLKLLLRYFGSVNPTM